MQLLKWHTDLFLWTLEGIHDIMMSDKYKTQARKLHHSGSNFVCSYPTYLKLSIYTKDTSEGRSHFGNF